MDGKTWAQVTTREIPTRPMENIPLHESAAASGQGLRGGGIPALGDIQHLPGQALSNLFQLWSQPCSRASRCVSPTHLSNSRVLLPAPKWEKSNSSPPSALRRDLSKKAEVNFTYG